MRNYLELRKKRESRERGYESWARNYEVLHPLSRFVAVKLTQFQLRFTQSAAPNQSNRYIKLRSTHYGRTKSHLHSRFASFLRIRTRFRFRSTRCNFPCLFSSLLPAAERRRRRTGRAGRLRVTDIQVERPLPYPATHSLLPPSVSWNGAHLSKCRTEREA